MRIIVVGGVAAGMSAAARARRLDESAEIIVLERGSEVSFANCGLPYHLSGEIAEAEDLLLHTPASLRAALDLDVRLRHGVIGIDPDAKTVTATTPDGAVEIPYDALILTPGAAALHPPLPGLDSARVRTLRTVGDAVALREQVTAGARRAVVLGAGFIGVEAAEALRAAGLSVDVVELAPHALPPLERELATLVHDELGALGITVHAGVAAESIESDDAADHVRLADGTVLDADIVVLSVGVRPDTAFAADAGIETLREAMIVDDRGRTSVADVWAAGDATVSIDAVTGVARPVALAGPANRAGRLIADDILGGDTTARRIPAALGTAIVRVGSLTVAMTGANRRSLDDAQIPYETIHLHPNQHAGYFPGAAPVHLLAHIDPADGRILGAQAAGVEGIDKRIDVIATAMRGDLRAPDLIDLDLSYSPPYGSAKDAVNMLGMVAENVVTGRLRLWHAADAVDGSDALILDVRTRAEFATGHLPGALNIPHTDLRERIDDVRDAADGRPVRVLCAAGVRSHIAHRVLVAHGFDSTSLSGGTRTLRQWFGDAVDDVLVTEGVLA
ncbi:FAD-dependent oxidoreductase [Microbacterium xanthum]|uniref:FAD-dependent oxidoreductase n=1 Tax=Microbacterium xanthum TaxID=3079794 RepID=UPI002AD3753C|nr:FAD-dependent oxidoreductase [Microbacterium sp. KSW-48]MDZ8173297.1 FAD-dependent oxidoreductase [Microbacterium sp. KSW-48]